MLLTRLEVQDIRSYDRAALDLGPGVTVLLGPPEEITFDDDEHRALDVLAAGGLVPPLRMVTPVEGPAIDTA